MKKQLMVTAMASSLVLAGCASTPNSNTNNGPANWNKTAVGAVAGAALGAVISKATGGDKTGRDAAIGAAIGAGVGAYMQKQAKQLEKQMAGTGVDVAYDPKTNDINITMPGSITFDTAKTNVKSQFTGTLNKLASTMKQYNQTKVVVMGHTDNVPIHTAQFSSNQQLSEARAYSVASYLNNHGVEASRISTIGYGSTRPVASNATPAGKAKNRRVEIKIDAPQSIS